MNLAEVQPPLVSSQKWKLWLALLGLLAAAALMTFEASITRALGAPRYLATLIGTALGLLTLLLAALAVRCPSCQLSLVWFAVSKQTSSLWLSWLLEAKSCPRCGHTAGQGRPIA